MIGAKKGFGDEQESCRTVDHEYSKNDFWVRVQLKVEWYCFN